MRSNRGLEVNSWVAFRDLCGPTRKNLSNQFEDCPDRYELYGPDSGGITWHTTVLKTNPRNEDQIDFEDNFKASFNWAVGARPYAFATGDFDFSPKSATDTCAAGSSKSVLIQMCGTKYMNGGKLITDGSAAFGDWVRVDVVDHDNLLGYGVDFILKTWVEKWYIDYKSCVDSIETPYAGLPPAGMYLKMTYNSTGVVPVGFALNIFMHKAI